ncbi:hypothetical protein, partial [Intestinibacter sp.]
LYNTLYLQYKKYGQEARDKFNKILVGYKDLDDLVADGFDTSLDVVKIYMDDAIEILKKMEVASITEEDFTKKYYQKYCSVGAVFSNLEYKYNKIEKLASEEKVNIQKREIFEDIKVRNEILDSVKNSVVYIHEAILDCLQNETTMDVYRVTQDDKNEAKELLQKLNSGGTSIDDKTRLDILEKMLGSDPYLEETYFYLMDINKGDDDNQMEEYANYFGIDLGKKKAELIYDEINKYLDEIDKCPKNNLEIDTIENNKSKVDECCKRYFDQKYIEKGSYANKVYLNSLDRIYKNTFKEFDSSENLKKLIKECDEVYNEYGDNRFLELKKIAEDELLKNTSVLNLKKEAQDKVAQNEKEINIVQDKEPAQVQKTQKQEQIDREDKNFLVYEESALAVEYLYEEEKTVSWYVLKIVSIALMLFSSTMIFGALTQLLGTKTMNIEDAIKAGIIIILPLVLSLFCNAIATKIIFPNGKYVSNKSMMIRLVIGFVCVLIGIISGEVYIRSVFFTVAVMVLLYVIRDSLFRYNDANVEW